MSSIKQFWKEFGAAEVETALKTFEKLSGADKLVVFSELFQRSEYSRTPHSVSVLFRKLHEGKTFEDFHKAWFPPEEHLDTEEVAGQTFHQFFPAPIRVINAVNMNDPKEIVSIGLHWLTEEQAAQKTGMATGKKHEDRGSEISKVADKEKADVYLVREDDNLGTPF